ncbi:hypothetical protein BX666DRAFT_1855230, partial [Dichotomocladium elegans]
NQIPAILDYVNDGIQQLHRFRNYVKDRAQVEREYAQKLESLAKKYQQTKPSSTGESEWEYTAASTCNAAWVSIVDQTGMVAKCHFQLADNLNGAMIESLKGTIMRKEEARKKKDKAKSLYDDSCMEVQNIHNKLAKGSGDPEKQQKQLENAIIECNNKKNTYLLALEVANAEKEKYFEEDLPILADALLPVDQIDAKADANMFQTSIEPDIAHRNSGTITYFTFLPWNGGSNAATTVVDTDDTLVIDEPSVIFLNNKLIKDRRLLDQLGDELSRNSTIMKDLETELKERLVEVSRSTTLLSTQKARVKSELDLIIQSIGDSGLSLQSHDFKASSFTIPTTCDYCGSTIWGLSKQGMTCKACGLNCHAKCEMKVAPNCTRVKGKINRHHPAPAPQPSPSATPRTSNVTNMSTSPTTSSTLNEAKTVPVETTLAVRALYDYTAQSSDELTIHENEVLKIVGSEDDGENGWLRVSRGSEIGYSTPPSSPATFVVALYDFQAVNADELNIREGDRILVTKKDDSGWWEGTLDGRSGIFPANYVEE